MPLLKVKRDDELLATFEIEKGATLSIGRHHDNDIIVDNPGASTRHAKIVTVEHGYLLTDLQSKNGSYVNGELVTSQILKHGDIVTIGSHVIEFEDRRSRDTTHRTDDSIQSSAGIGPTAASSGIESADSALADLDKPLPRGILKCLTDNGEDVELKKRITRVGNGAGADVLLHQWRAGKTAAVIARRRDGFYISRTGGFLKLQVNDRPLIRSAKLHHADVIRIGAQVMQFEDNEETLPERSD